MIAGAFLVNEGVSIQFLLMVGFDGRSMEIRGKYGPIIDGDGDDDGMTGGGMTGGGMTGGGMTGGPTALVTSKFTARMLHLMGRELSDLKSCRKDNIVSEAVIQKQPKVC